MPEGSRIVVCNATPIITLAIVGQVGLLQRLYGTVLIPPAVEAEILAGGPRHGAKELSQSEYIQTVPLVDTIKADLLSDLDRGEAEAIALALEKRAGLLIMDERLGRRHAARLGLTLTGSIGILLKSKQAGYLDAIQPLLEQIEQNGIYLSQSLINQALQQAGEL